MNENEPRELVVFRTEEIEDLSDFQLQLRTAHLEQLEPVYPFETQKGDAKIALEACRNILDARGIKEPDSVVNEQLRARVDKKFASLPMHNRQKKSSK